MTYALACIVKDERQQVDRIIYKYSQYFDELAFADPNECKLGRNEEPV